MSLKAIKEAVCDLKRRADALGDDAAWNLALLAEQQIAALEKAANNLPVPGVGQWSQPEWDEAVLSILELMRSIAKEADS
jgi:hypothetical protein